MYQVAHDEGRYSPALGFEFSYTDHLGNVRLMFRDSSGVAAITQTENFGAWGESLKSLNYYRGANGKEQFVFTGHERDEDLGVYDAKARMYDPLVPRFWSQDYLADVFNDLTPYNYALNNPLLYVDPSGDSSINVQDLNMRTFDVNNDVVQLPTFQASGERSRPDPIFGNLYVNYARNYEYYGHSSPYREYFHQGGEAANWIITAPGVANTFRVNPPRRGFNNLYFNGLRKFNCLGLVG